MLEPAAEAQLSEARDLLAALREALAEFGAPAEDRSHLASSIRQLDDLFLLVVVGEFNSGKSAFINALLGQVVAKEGVTPTTAEIVLLRYGDTMTSHTDASGVRVLTAPAELLRDVHIVDTPGTNAIRREHERITRDFVPRADLVLFLTSADRPFTETERAFLTAIRDWGKKIVVVLNKIDIFSEPAELQQVTAFVSTAARDLLGVSVDVLPVSARLALRAKQGEPSVWRASGFEALEQYLRQTLDAASRFRLKLSNPLGVGLALATRFAAIAGERLAVMDADLQLLGDIDRQLAAYRNDMQRGFELRMTEIDQVLAEMEARGDRFFEDTLRLARVADLLNRGRIQREFEDKVVGEAPALIERRVAELIDWFVDQDFRQWEAVTRKLAERQREHASRVLGSPEIGSFHGDRARLIDSVGRQAQSVVSTYDKRREAEAIADQARTSVAAAAAAGGAAVGLGTIVSIAASTVAADVTGILLAGLVLGVGFLIIPARRRRAKMLLQEKVGALRTQLSTALHSEFERAQAASANRLADAMAPYRRFVRTEEQRWQDARRTLEALRDKTKVLLAQLASSVSA